MIGHVQELILWGALEPYLTRTAREDLQLYCLSDKTLHVRHGDQRVLELRQSAGLETAASDASISLLESLDPLARTLLGVILRAKLGFVCLRVRPFGAPAASLLLGLRRPGDTVSCASVASIVLAEHEGLPVGDRHIPVPAGGVLH